MERLIGNMVPPAFAQLDLIHENVQAGALHVWATRPSANHYNKAGRPVSPVRTDDRTGLTVGRK